MSNIVVSWPGLGFPMNTDKFQWFVAGPQPDAANN